MRLQIIVPVLLMAALRLSIAQDSANAKVDRIRELLTRMRDTQQALAQIPVPFSKDDLPLFGPFLEDKTETRSLAFYAQYTMQRIDESAAIPIDIRYLPRSEANAQRDMIGLMIRHSRDSGFPRTNARAAILEALSVPPGPRSRPAFDYNLIMGLGAFGEQSDVQLIKKLYHTELNDSKEPPRQRLQDALRWATARLGDEASLNEVRLRLVPLDPKDPGFQNARMWRAYMDEIGHLTYINRPALLPALEPSLRSNIDPPFFECFIFIPPPRAAMDILKKLVDPTDYPPKPDSPDAWIEWLKNRYTPKS